jgi:hypothetical protein
MWSKDKSLEITASDTSDLCVVSFNTYACIYNTQNPDENQDSGTPTETLPAAAAAAVPPYNWGTAYTCSKKRQSISHYSL